MPVPGFLKARSVAVRPFHSAWFMKRHDPPPPLLLTMIMNAIVIPRTTSRLRSLVAPPGREAVLADSGWVTAAFAANLHAGEPLACGAERLVALREAES